jgi:Arc/MetJ family transcription regulator
MRITADLEAHLVDTAQRLTGLRRRSELLRAALTALIGRESARRLAGVGGSQPDLELPPRRRSDEDLEDEAAFEERSGETLLTFEELRKRLEEDGAP